MTLAELFTQTKQRLKNGGVEDYDYDALYLFEHIFGITHTTLLTNGNAEVDQNRQAVLNDCINRRLGFEPVQYIIGKWDFMGHSYLVGDGVLIPRDDTEVVVNACANMLHNNVEYKIVDLCSGSGIIAITLKLMFPLSTVFAVEKSDKAYAYLVNNRDKNNADISAVQGDVYTCYNDFEDCSLDLIVSNPPYITTDEIPSLQKEVQFEPKMALDGGVDGYDFYRAIIDKWSNKLKHGGVLAFELGEGQFEYISQLLCENGFCHIKGYCDLGGATRAVTAIYK